jgi:hypothetical protein
MCNILLIILLFLLIIISTFSVKNKCNNFVENMTSSTNENMASSTNKNMASSTNENMASSTNNFNKNNNYENSSFFKANLLEKIEFFSDNEPIEITTLPKCTKNINVDYGLSINTINNDGVSINHDINDPLIHTIEVDNKNYNLVKVELRKTNFTINNKQIGLTLHLIHTDYRSINNFIIIIPLDLNNLDQNNNILDDTNLDDTNLDDTNLDDTNLDNTNLDDTTTESFKNIFYKKMDNFFKKYNPLKDINKEISLKDITRNIPLKDITKEINNINKDIKNINKDIKKLKNQFNLSISYKRKYDIKNININSLVKKDDIPIYECCKNTIGNIIRMNLCQLKTIIENNDNYYIIKDQNENTNLITEPNIFNEDSGLLIRNYIESDNNLLYIKP